MPYSYLHHIVKDTKRRIENQSIPYEEEYRLQLKHLRYKERDIIKETFLQQEWNIGSAHVLAMLQDAGILTASEFILSLACAELTQQIMNDLLETEHTLLAHLVKFAFKDNHLSLTLTKVLQESFSGLLNDLKDNPNVIPCNYLIELKVHLPSEEHALVCNEHLRLLLTDPTQSGSLDEAIREQDRWRIEMEEVKDTILGSILLEILPNGTCLLTVLKKMLDSCGIISLKYALHLMRALSKRVGDDNGCVRAIKDWIKTLFTETVATGLTSKMQVMLLFAREICTANQNILGSYSAWYKQTIGEMKYGGIKKDQFIRMLEMLSAILPFETSLEVLKVQSTIGISAPIRCNEYVLNYKQLCRARIAELHTLYTQVDANGSIIIDE
ncbi:uncharacterized protein LOC125957339 isoform X1 [Anopheles darlingi]|uniref:uncharacterized protein LOC125957339 isoform X1 n=1 Tax=Anopheles darlingi TaxID=43151 RepID=UPI0021003240|nr:uncharacterized protein LOC125957339 isoform X1 [Anopheles darlingi]